MPNGETILKSKRSGPGSQNYLSRGHLSPDAGFNEGAEQDATYFFFNVAPQFQSFNNVILHIFLSDKQLLIIMVTYFAFSEKLEGNRKSNKKISL